MRLVERRGRLLVWCALTVLAGLMGAGYSHVAGGSALIGASVGLTICGALVAFELFVVQQPAGEPLRRLPLPLYIGVSTLIWAAIITLCVELVPAIIEYDEPDDLPDDDPTPLGQDLIFSFTIVLLLNTAIRVGALVGPRVLLNFVLGRYYRPLREHRVFMFLDLADSTHLSERLGDLKVQELIRAFFFDVARPVARHGGETHRYIGDEVVVTWPLTRDSTHTPWIQCVLDIRDLLETRGDWYEEHFGVVPRFRVGLHGGPVVASEIGDSKREIVYFGDTINTAARLGSACKELGVDALISAELLDRTVLPEGVATRAMGDLVLKGKASNVAVYTFGSHQ